MIKQLTKEQALQFVNYIRENINANEDVCFEDNGSSRAVIQFEWDCETYVVKFAGDMQGRRQNQIEMNLWENAGHEGFLAAIRYAYKDMFIICDYVDVLPFEVGEVAYECEPTYWWSKMVEYGYTYYFNLEEDASITDIEELHEEIYNTVARLEDYQGETNDNYQIGIGGNEFNNQTTKYSIVAYDYGYSTDVERCEQVGCVENEIHYGNYAASNFFDIELNWIMNDIEYNSEYDEGEEK